MIQFLQLRVVILCICLLGLSSCQMEQLWKGASQGKWSLSQALFGEKREISDFEKKSELEFFQKAGSWYLEGLFHRALLETEFALEYYPKSQRLDLLRQRLLKVIEAEREFFKVENPPPEQQNQDQNSEDQNNSSQQNNSSNQKTSSNQNQSATSSQNGQSSPQSQSGQSSQSGSAGANSSAGVNSSAGASSAGTSSQGDQGQSQDAQGNSSQTGSSDANTSSAGGASSQSVSSAGGSSSAGGAGETGSSEGLSEEELEKLKMEYIQEQEAKQLLELFEDQEGQRKFKKYRRSSQHGKDW